MAAINVNILNSWQRTPKQKEEPPAFASRRFDELPPGGDAIPTRGEELAADYRAVRRWLARQSRAGTFQRGGAARVWNRGVFDLIL